MKNVNVEDVDLRLALGPTNYRVRTRLSSSSGAGVNANTRTEMAFAASDPLSELVWSPQNGLSLKCTGSSLADDKPFLLWNVESSIKDMSTSESIRSKGSRDDKVDEEKLTLSQTIVQEDDKFGNETTLFRSSGGNSSSELDACLGQCHAGSNGKTEDQAGTNAIREENGKDNIDKDLCSSQNVQIADVAESSKKIAEQDILADGTNERKVETARNWPFSRKLSEALVYSLPNLRSQQDRDDEVTSASGDVNKNETIMPIPIPAPPLMKLEFSAENDFVHLAAKEVDFSGETRFPMEKSLPADKSPTNSRIHLYREKGKEKVHERSSNDEDNSHESMESCNSAVLFSKGVKRRNYDQEQLVGSKRMKTQIQENRGSTSILRPDSSFMKWISNMVKGLSDSNEEESSSLTLTLARSDDVCGNNHPEDFTCKKTSNRKSQNMGFQSVFQSLYCRNTKMSDSGVQKDNYPIEESKELIVADKNSLENLPGSCDRNNGNSCKQIILSNKEVTPHISRNIVSHRRKPWIFSADFACTPYDSERTKVEVSPSDSSHKQANINSENTNLMPEKSNPLSSLWITRLYTLSARLENSNPITEEARECSNLNGNLDSRITDDFSLDQKTFEPRDDSAADQVAGNVSVDLKSTFKPNHMQLSEKLRSSEAMASVFAKRMDALKHIIHPSEDRKSSTCRLTCFFCGRSGHDLRKCRELTETELEDLLVKISSFDGIEETPRLCIRCFQLDHWAISCPLLSGGKDKCSSYLGGDENDRKLVAARQMACSVRKPCLNSYMTWNGNDSSRKRLSTSSESIQKFQPHYVGLEEMFHAIRKLRLSRSDILRWMNSDISLSQLNGFFLRLRLGKSGAGLGRTGYYVACITGDTVETIGCKSEKSILVDVGGIKSYVGSQYVSNQDFLEDEIKTWWTGIVKTGGKIPSLHELNSKFEHRKCLRF